MSSIKMRLLPLAAAGFAFALCTASPVAAQDANACVRLSDLQHIRTVDDEQAVASTSRDSFLIRFLPGCSVHSAASHFIFDQSRLGLCLQSGMVIETSDGLDCVITEIVPLRDVPIEHN